MAKDKAGGQPLKEVWKTLTAATVTFKRGGLTIIGAGPGVGKSVFALTLAVQSGARTIYFSADSGPGTQLSRTVSMKMERETNEIVKAIEEGELFETELVDLKRIRWDFDAGPTLDSIEESVDAYAFLHGDYPELIVVDNLMDVVADQDGDNPATGMHQILQFLKELARNTGALVVVCAHLVGEFENGDTPPPLGALINKVSKVPEQALMLYRKESMAGGEGMGVVINKNRGGRANAAGKFEVELEMNLSRMLIKDYDNNNRFIVPVFENTQDFDRVVTELMGGDHGA